MLPLFSQHPPALAVLYGDLESFALAQEQAFIGTAGSVVERSNAGGFEYFAHQRYDANGKKRETYLAGPKGSPVAEAAAERLRERIRDAKAIVPSLRLLGREGFQVVDAKTYATLASLHNRGLFAAGAMLIGSHAYGVILNRLGVRGASYATLDVDIARPRKLVFEAPLDETFIQILVGSGVDFVEVPPLERTNASTSFKERGRSTFQVDLLVPSRNEMDSVVKVTELGAHATALPYLGYLLAESQNATLLAREGCLRARVPLPERYAVHKLLVSRLRVGRDAKSTKDVSQAAVLCAALSALHPGAIESAVAAVPSRARRHLKAALRVVAPLLEQAHPRAIEELTS